MTFVSAPTGFAVAGLPHVRAVHRGCQFTSSCYPRPRSNRLCSRNATMVAKCGHRREPERNVDLLLSNSVTPKRAVLEDSTVVSRLHRLLRSRTFLARVAKRARCDFARYTGVVFERPEVTDTCPDGIPESMQRYQEDLRYVIINVPPGIVARSLAQPEAVPGTAADVYAQHLADAFGDITLAAVFKRHGVEADVLDREQEARNAQVSEIEIQLKAWSDVSDARRTETDSYSLNRANLYEESLEDLLGMA